MYLLFRHHHILPGTFYEMGFGERKVIKAFMHYEVDTRNREVEEIEKMWR